MGLFFLLVLLPFIRLLLHCFFIIDSLKYVNMLLSLNVKQGFSMQVPYDPPPRTVPVFP